MTKRDIDQQLNAYLADAHSIEEQALTQLRRAPRIAGDRRLADVFAQHLAETESQESRIEARLDARGAHPSRIKDLAGRAGGLGMVAFARLNPDTPGKLTAHAYSYEHLEVAAYELLRRAAERAGDAETAALAREIEAEERRMGERLASSFDEAVEASLHELAPDDLGEQLDKYLADAHAIEAQALQLLRLAPRLVDDPQLEAIFADHLEETRGHSELIERRLEARGASPSRFEDAGMRIGALNLAAFFAAQPDTAPKLAGFAFAFEHLEIAAYELLRRIAGRAGDLESVGVAEAILADERAAAQRLEASFDSAIAIAMPAR